MGLPGHRRTSSHKRRRAAHFALKPLAVQSCPSCHAPKLPHKACGNCGAYAGRKIMTTAALSQAKSSKKAKPTSKK